MFAKNCDQKVPSSFPTFDVILLGMGPNGHTASLFPSHPLLNEQDRWAVAVEDSPIPSPWRITLALPVINHAERIAFVESGNDNEDMVTRVLDRPEEGLPSSKVRPVGDGELYWVLDDAASVKAKHPKTEFKVESFKKNFLKNAVNVFVWTLTVLIVYPCNDFQGLFSFRFPGDRVFYSLSFQGKDTLQAITILFHSSRTSGRRGRCSR